MKLWQKQLVFGLLLVGVAILVVLTLAYTRKAGTNPTDISTSLTQLVELEDMLIPDQELFQADEANRKALALLANRWGVDEDQIYMIVQDAEPWIQIVGLLDIKSLSSARIWILETNNKEGKNWENYLIRQGVPHEGNIYVFSEYKPRGRVERDLATQFYSTKTLGGLAIIEDIQWTDFSSRTGIILAYQSQRYLPTITITIKDGIPLKNQAHQTPLLHD